MNYFKPFRLIAHLEGYSFLILLLIAMPLKYIWHEPVLIRPVGMAHGVLFIAYLVLALLMKKEQNWNTTTTFQAMIVSVLPLGTFWFVNKLKHKKS